MNSRGVYRLGLYEKSMPGELPFEEKLKAAKETGYDFLYMEDISRVASVIRKEIGLDK